MEWFKYFSSLVTLSYCPIRCIVHHEIRSTGTILYTIIKDPDNMRMIEFGNSRCLFAKVFFCFTWQLYMLQQFDGSLSLQMHMFSNINLSIPTLSQFANQLII